VTAVQDATGVRPRLRWWRELLYIAVFYFIYSSIRNLSGTEARAHKHALTIIKVEKALGLYHEHAFQHLFGIHQGADYHHLHLRTVIQFWNVYYGGPHFAVTIVAIIWLFRFHPERYPLWRNTLAFTTALALIGFALFPLMPPRLIGHGFVDTLEYVGGLWSFHSGPINKVSNQYAAMPSLHFAWALWCTCVFYPSCRRWWTKALAIAHPVCTFFAIVVTANHYIIDALGGVVILVVGYVLGRAFTEMWERRAQPAANRA
jgi:hypothetical protein